MNGINQSDSNESNLTLSMKMYLRMIREFPKLSEDEEKELFIRKANGEEGIFQKLLEANLCLVVELSMEYVEKGVPLEDLVFDGNNALVEAINTFDHKDGCKFRAYAKELIIKALENVRKEYEEGKSDEIDPPPVEWEDLDNNENNIRYKD